MNYTINPETNRPIRIGGPTYNSLILRYYTDSDGRILNQRKITDDIFSFYNDKKFKKENERTQSKNKYTINPETGKKIGICYIINTIGMERNLQVKEKIY